MRHKVVVFFLLMLVHFVPYSVRANDYWEDPATLVLNQELPICWSLENMDQYANEYLFLYDYSSTTGRKVGAPWALVEQGVCYATDLSETLYAFKKPIVPAVAALLKSTGTTAPETDVSDILGAPDMFVSGHESYGIFPSVKGYSALAAVIPEIYHDTRQLVHMMPFNIQDALPTRYIPGEGIAGEGALWNPDLPLYADARFIEAKKIIGTLAVELGNAIADCDTREVVEVRTMVEFASGTIPVLGGVPRESAPLNMYTTGMDVWHLKGYGNISGSRLRGIPALEIIGCTARVGVFYRDHKTDVERFDALMMSLEQAYGGVSYGSSYGLMQTYTFPKRDSKDYANLLAFAYYGKAPRVPAEQLVSTPPIARVTQEVGPVATIAADMPPISMEASSSNTAFDQNLYATPTVVAPEPLESRFFERNADSDRLSDRVLGLDTYMTLYYFVALPLLGVAGLVFFYKKIRLSRKRESGELPDET